MPRFANAMEVFKLLNQSNCRKCNESTCLAFAGKVFLGQKQLDLCPDIDPRILARYAGKEPAKAPGAGAGELLSPELKQALAGCDLERAAERTGGTWHNGWLTLRVFGKPFALNNQGRFKSDLHINPWMVMPILSYVLECKGVPLKGEWIPFREVKGGREKNSLFVQRGETPLREIADRYPALFEDLVQMFSATALTPLEKVESQYESDISLVLYPLPKLPMLICYWKPDEGLESDLNLFFDKSANLNGSEGMLFNLATGMVRMFEKFVITHGPGE